MRLSLPMDRGEWKLPGQSERRGCGIACCFISRWWVKNLERGSNQEDLVVSLGKPAPYPQDRCLEKVTLVEWALPTLFTVFVLSNIQ